MESDVECHPYKGENQSSRGRGKNEDNVGDRAIEYQRTFLHNDCKGQGLCECAYVTQCKDS